MLLQILDQPSDVSDYEKKFCVPTHDEAISTCAIILWMSIWKIYKQESIGHFGNIRQGQVKDETWFDHRRGY